MYKEIKIRLKNLSENWKFKTEKKEEKKRNLKVEDATTEMKNSMNGFVV